MTDPDELLEEESVAANRAEARRAAIITAVALGAIVAASALAVAAGIPAG